MDCEAIGVYLIIDCQIKGPFLSGVLSDTHINLSSLRDAPPSLHTPSIQPISHRRHLLPLPSPFCTQHHPTLSLAPSLLRSSPSTALLPTR